MEILKLLLMLFAANGAPVLATRVLDGHGAWPVDGGRHWCDGRPLFGPSKTWRGLVMALLAAGSLAPLLGWPVGVGLAIGVGAMAGDLLSSFVKRRLGRPSSSQALGIDQIPEALLPLLAVRETLALDVMERVDTRLDRHDRQVQTLLRRVELAKDDVARGELLRRHRREVALADGDARRADGGCGNEVALV